MKNITEEDIAWTEERTIALMHEGIPFADAVELAGRECAQRVLDRELEWLKRLEDERDRRREERQKQQANEFEAHRAELQAKATPGQRPTLKATLGDMLTRRR